MKKVEVCFSPALYPFYHNPEAVVVVVDIFRASTSICTALINGASRIFPVASVEEAQTYKEKGYLVGAERNVERCDFADFGNSPFDYTPDHVREKEIVFTTTNGTQAIQAAVGAHALVIGAFINLSSVTRFCKEQQRDVLILCSGWNNRINFEDVLFAGALAEQLTAHHYEIVSDGAMMSELLWKQSKKHPKHLIERSEHYQRLKKHGFQDQVNFCLSIDLVEGLPVLKDNVLVLI